MSDVITLNIGDNDRNADWIKTPKNRKTEQQIADAIAKELEDDNEQ